MAVRILVDPLGWGVYFPWHTGRWKLYPPQGLEDSDQQGHELLVRLGVEYGFEVGLIEPHILATQCGTSIEMLQRYYSHVKAKVHAKRLAGGNSIVKDPLAASASVVDLGKLEVGVDKDGYIVVKE